MSEKIEKRNTELVEMIDALRRFMARHNIDDHDVRVDVSFPKLTQSSDAERSMYVDYDPQYMELTAFNKIMGIRIHFSGRDGWEDMGR